MNLSRTVNHATSSASLNRPGVTTIIRAGLTAGERLTLQITEKHGVDNRQRGTDLHCLCQRYVLRQELGLVPRALAEHWASLPVLLDSFSRMLWAEQGLAAPLAGLTELRPPGLPFLGRPDLLGLRAGKLELVEVKVADSPYSRIHPRKGEERFWHAKNRHLKLQLAFEQLEGYRRLLEPLGVRVDDLVVFVALPGRVQQFRARPEERAAAMRRFDRRLARYNAELSRRAKERQRGLALAAKDFAGLV